MIYAIILLALVAIYQHFRITYVRNQWTKLLKEFKNTLKVSIVEDMVSNRFKEYIEEFKSNISKERIRREKEQSLKDALEYLNGGKFKDVVERAKMYISYCVDLAENPIPKPKDENSFKLIMDKAMRGIITSEEAYKEYEANRNK